MPGIFDILAANGILNSLFSGPRPTDTGDDTQRMLNRQAAALSQQAAPKVAPQAAASAPSPVAPVPMIVQAMQNGGVPVDPQAGGGSFLPADAEQEIAQAQMDPRSIVPAADPYANTSNAAGVAFQNQLAAQDGGGNFNKFVRAADIIGKGLMAAGSSDPARTLAMFQEADSERNRTKVTPLADGAFSMVQEPGKPARIVRNDQVAQYLGDQQQAKFQRDIEKARVVAEAGVLAANKKAAGAEQVKTAGDSATTDLNVKELTRIQEALGNTDTASGPLVGNLPKFLRDTFFPEGTSLQDSAERIIQSSLRQTLGAQFTEKEGSAFLARAYNPRVSETENARRLGVVIEEIKGIQNNKEAALDYMRRNGTLQGFVPPATPVAPEGRSNESRPDISSQAQSAFGAYEPDVYEYRINNGVVQRRKKQ